jgi:hypothetical protein
LVKDGDEENVSIFSFNPILRLGLQWAIVPDKFYLNAGSSIEFFRLGLETTTTDNYTQGTKNDGSTVEAIDRSFGGASTKLMLGFTVNPTANLGVQAMSGIDTSNNVSVFSTSASSGLAVFSKIMVTLKF